MLRRAALLLALASCGGDPQAAEVPAAGSGPSSAVAPPPAHPPAKPEAPARDDSPIGVAACDRFLERMAACLPRLPESEREATRQQLASTRAGWREATRAGGDVARAALQRLCEAAIDGAGPGSPCFP